MPKEKKYNAVTIILKVMPYLWSADWKIRVRFLLAVLLTIIAIAATLAVPIVLKEIINQIAVPNANLTLKISLILIAYGAIWTFSMVAAQLQQIAFYRVFERGIRLLGLKIFEHLHLLSARFHYARKTGGVTNAIERAQGAIPVVFWGLFFLLIPTGIEVLIAGSVLCYLYGMFYGVTLFLIIIVFVIYSFYGTKHAAAMQRLANDKAKVSSAYLVDCLLNFETIKYFASSKTELLRCDEMFKQREEVMTKQYTYMNMVGVGQSIIIGLGLTILTYFSSKAVLLHQGFNIGDFILVNGYLLQFAMPLYSLGFVIRQMRQGLTDMENALELLAEKPDIMDGPNALPLRITEGKVVFERVKFSYGPTREILKEISFSLSPGKTVAIVGSTGAGKSTITRLLFRLFEPDAGRILIDGQDIRQVTQESLRNYLGIVPQDTMLFNNTLFYNITYGYPDAPRELVEKAVKMACLDALIQQLPQGYETTVGERGVKLSGGEKQRIAIARALLKNPQIYIFDEATSALDLQTEKEITDSFRNISRDHSRLIITHRLSTIIDADEIIVLNDGEIVEQGSHAALLALNGFYATLWQNQSKFLN